MADLMTAALDLASAGWAVFPCDERPGDHEKAPRVPPPGHHLATTDPDQIRAWWKRWPNAMIGAPVPAPLLVIDLDPRNNPNCLADLEALAGPLPATLTAWSGRGDAGRHHYFLRPAGQLTSTRLPDGVDLKAAGYCIVPPSIHPASGQPYRWDQQPAARLPYRLRELLRPAPPPPRPARFDTPGDGGALVAWLARQTSNANDALYWAARRAAERGILTPALEADLVAAAGTAAAGAGRLGQGGGERQSWRTVQSARQAVGGIR